MQNCKNVEAHAWRKSHLDDGKGIPARPMPARENHIPGTHPRTSAQPAPPCTHAGPPRLQLLTGRHLFTLSLINTPPSDLPFGPQILRLSESNVPRRIRRRAPTRALCFAKPPPSVHAHTDHCPRPERWTEASTRRGQPRMCKANQYLAQDGPMHTQIPEELERIPPAHQILLLVPSFVFSLISPFSGIDAVRCHDGVVHSPILSCIRNPCPAF